MVVRAFDAHDHAIVAGVRGALHSEVMHATVQRLSQAEVHAGAAIVVGGDDRAGTVVERAHGVELAAAAHVERGLGVQVDAEHVDVGGRVDRASDTHAVLDGRGREQCIAVVVAGGLQADHHRSDGHEEPKPHQATTRATSANLTRAAL